MHALDSAQERLDSVKDPKGFAFLLNAVSRASDALLSLDERRPRRLQAQLNRRKTEADIALLEAKAKGLVPPDVTINIHDSEAVDKVIRETFGNLGARAHAAPPSTSGEGLGEPSLPVPGKMGE